MTRSFEKMVIIGIMISLSTLIILISGCTDTKTTSAELYENKYDKGLKIYNYDSQKKPIIEYFHAIPDHVIVVNLNELNTMLALGLGDKVIDAVVNTDSAPYKEMISRYPEEMSKVRHVSKFQLSKEQAIADTPDFILGWKSTFSSK